MIFIKKETACAVSFANAKEYAMIEITALNKIYKSKKRKTCHALKDINLAMPDAGLVFVLGKSGSGKSTLLNLIGGLDNVTSGSIEVDGNDLAKFREKDFCNYRNTHIGFIFQDYHLIDELTVYENIVLSLNLRKIEDKEHVKSALEKVDLAGYEDRYPTELSGGEQQRVAIARAIVKNPRIILADEPTGNLDTNTARAIVQLLKDLSKECLILVVSHNINDANSYADRIIELKKGQIVSDKSRNPDFSDEVTLKDGNLVYPKDTYLSDRDIEFINENTGAKLVKRTDKFIITPENKDNASKVKIENKSLTLGKELKLSGKFLKSKTFAIAFSSFMVAVIMVIMSLAQTIIAFDGGEIVAEEMAKKNSDSLYVTKLLSEEQKASLNTIDRAECYPEIYENEIQKFIDSGYKGKVYEVYKNNIHIVKSTVSAGATRTFFTTSPYILETFGTMVVDEEFFERKFGEVTYLAKAEEFHPTGVIITDYVADAIMLSGQVKYARDYEGLIGGYHWGSSSNRNSDGYRGYINGIIYTGYKEKYAEVFEKYKNGEFSDYQAIYESEIYQSFIEDVYGGLGFCYSLNPDFKEQSLTDPAWDMLWHYTLQFEGVEGYYSTNTPQIRHASLYEMELGDYEVVMNLSKYNEFFGTNYTSSTAKDFTPRTVKLTHYKHFDLSTPLFSEEITIVGISNNIGGTFVVGDELYDLFQMDHSYVTGLYFDGTEGIGAVLDMTDELNYEPQSFAVEGIHTMTTAVDVFVPIFELVAIFLCIGVIFILMSFASKMIKDKMHEIGIMKALGTKNNSIGVIFGLQVALIAALTCALATVGYFAFIDLANDVLIESLMRFSPSSVVLDLDFLTFRPEIAMKNCILIMALALISLIFPMIKIKAIKPVKIIKAKE